jgi:hypothetical protein
LINYFRNVTERGPITPLRRFNPLFFDEVGNVREPVSKKNNEKERKKSKIMNKYENPLPSPGILILSLLEVSSFSKSLYIIYFQ